MSYIMSVWMLINLTHIRWYRGINLIVFRLEATFTIDLESIVRSGVVANGWVFVVLWSASVRIHLILMVKISLGRDFILFSQLLIVILNQKLLLSLRIFDGWLFSLQGLAYGLVRKLSLMIDVLHIRYSLYGICNMLFLNKAMVLSFSKHLVLSSYSVLMVYLLLGFD